MLAYQDNIKDTVRQNPLSMLAIFPKAFICYNNLKLSQVEYMRSYDMTKKQSY